MGKVNFPPTVKVESDSAIIWDDSIGSILYSLGFFGKPLGLRKVKPGKLERPLVLSLFDLLYLKENSKLNILLRDKIVNDEEFTNYADSIYEGFRRKYLVYKHLRKLGYIVRPGMKFGSDFVIYEIGPGFDHSKWVVHVEKNDAEIKAINIVRAGRLAASVKKKYLISTLTNHNKPKPIFYSFDRVKI